MLRPQWIVCFALNQCGSLVYYFLLGTAGQKPPFPIQSRRSKPVGMPSRINLPKLRALLSFQILVVDLSRFVDPFPASASIGLIVAGWCDLRPVDVLGVPIFCKQTFQWQCPYATVLPSCGHGFVFPPSHSQSPALIGLSPAPSSRFSPSQR